MYKHEINIVAEMYVQRYSRRLLLLDRKAATIVKKEWVTPVNEV